MSRTYKATGINLKSMPLGESDRLLTILTREYGLVLAIAMGSRKHNSHMSGRSGLFVVNELLIAKGRSLDKITQAETLESYPGLGQDLKKLIASQYLAELCLCQALSDQPQDDLFCLVNEHLERLERSLNPDVLAHLTHAVFQLLVLAGIAPQVHTCCLTRQPLIPDLTDPNWRIGFSIPTGGAVTLAALETLLAEQRPHRRTNTSAQLASPAKLATGPSKTAEATVKYGNQSAKSTIQLYSYLTAAELALLQQLAQIELPLVEPETTAEPSNRPSPEASPPETRSTDATEVWHSAEHLLRHYAQYHFDRPIRSAALIDACFAPADPS